MTLTRRAGAKLGLYCRYGIDTWYIVDYAGGLLFRPVRFQGRRPSKDPLNVAFL